ncbi:helix-turn-helix domain-containing protein [Mycolicibacter heraklionensis]|uniref:helix-turn-helix domain-containing protein n=1 Tax=Mycolicibacter heraklionensis TaxID=512402 RepID=UPI0009EF047A|nr:helix-turn-helix domain-containing protein [Mycolicibacter heraklionensis]
MNAEEREARNQRILALTRAGKSITETMAIVNCSESTVTKVRRRYGLSRTIEPRVRFATFESALATGMPIEKALNESAWGNPESAARFYYRYERELPPELVGAVRDCAAGRQTFRSSPKLLPRQIVTTEVDWSCESDLDLVGDAAIDLALRVRDEFPGDLLEEFARMAVERPRRLAQVVLALAALVDPSESDERMNERLFAAAASRVEVVRLGRRRVS